MACMIELLYESVGIGNPEPVYIDFCAVVIRILWEMAMESGGYFDYFDFRGRLNKLKLNLFDFYLDLTNTDISDYFINDDVTILDLSYPFVNQNTTYILFHIAIDLFLYTHLSRGKMIYIIDIFTTKIFTKTFLTIIRQQQHLRTNSTRKGLSQVARLQTNKTIIFASSAHLVEEDNNIINTQYKIFKVIIRKRIIWDGGQSIICIY
ncbi:uncharacterized protein N7506_012327 [Penicillium brevicompactum]|uniref:uncharacterized protein n=1 Tax=Penicillium brevicompactum TaxID=5074 RepID=UPI002540CCD5|nr:uncharacterized protein N7506_012327 [Penicillium brevicompactum]KAJ5319623.1 hypothetical protein N7506_012327 [Penicillium brevicompactum]